jgi:hypothetical protein
MNLEGYGGTDQHDHHMLIMVDCQRKLHVRYSRCARGLSANQQWLYYFNQAKAEFPDFRLEMVVADPHHVHVEANIGGVAQPEVHMS